MDREMEILIDCDEYGMSVEAIQYQQIDHRTTNVFYLKGHKIEIGNKIKQPALLPSLYNDKSKNFMCLDPLQNDKYWVFTRTRKTCTKQEFTFKQYDVDLDLLDTCPLCNTFIPYKYLRLKSPTNDAFFPMCPSCKKDLSSYITYTRIPLRKTNERLKDYVKGFAIDSEDATVECVKWARKHEALRKEVCEICGKLVYLHLHRKVHDETEITCKICGAKVLGKFMERHTRNIHETTLCEMCGKIVKVPQLWRHRLIHNDKMHKCPKCDAEFHYKKSLVRHQMVHDKDKSSMFLCKFCGNLYTSPWNLQQHIRIHTNVTPYRCLLCKRNFRYNCSLKRHIVTNHPGKSIPESITRIMDTGIGKEKETMDGVLSSDEEDTENGKDEKENGKDNLDKGDNEEDTEELEEENESSDSEGDEDVDES